jgi:archaellum component FlaG (FlaF/FlaG flagellin family)
VIVEIQTASNWPIVVAVNGDINIPERTNVIDRDGSYIILLPDGNITNFRTQMNRLATAKFGYRR